MADQPKGTSAFLIQGSNWEHNDEYHSTAGEGEVEGQGYSTLEAAQTECDKLNRDEWRGIEDLLSYYQNDFEGDAFDEDFTYEELGKIVNQQIDTIDGFTLPDNLTDAEVDQVRALFPAVTFYEVVAVKIA